VTVLFTAENTELGRDYLRLFFSVSVFRGVLRARCGERLSFFFRSNWPPVAGAPPAAERPQHDAYHIIVIGKLAAPSGAANENHGL